MPPPPPLTDQEWIALRRRLFAYAFKKCTKNVEKAKELVQAAIAKSLEPRTTPWDPEAKTFLQYLCDLLRSLHGNETKSFRVVRASFSLGEQEEETIEGAAGNAEALMLEAHEAQRAARLYSALLLRIEGDTLLLLLLEDDDEGSEDEQDEQDACGPGNEMPADDEPSPDNPKKPRTLPASTRRALANGYTHTDIKHARERLKRHALAVVRADREAHHE